MPKAKARVVVFGQTQWLREPAQTGLMTQGGRGEDPGQRIRPGFEQAVKGMGGIRERTTRSRQGPSGPSLSTQRTPSAPSASI